MLFGFSFVSEIAIKSGKRVQSLKSSSSLCLFLDKLLTFRCTRNKSLELAFEGIFDSFEGKYNHHKYNYNQSI